MKRMINRALIVIASGAIAFHSGGCGIGGGFGDWGRFIGDALGDALWLRGID